MSNVLIVEDVGIVAEDINCVVQNFGYNVIGVTHNMHDALDVASNNKVDIALLDINLNGHFEGLKLGEILNAKYGISIIFISAFDKRKTSSTNYKFNFLSKPYDELKLHELLSKIDGCMEE